MLPSNVAKKPAKFIGGQYVNQKKKQLQGPGHDSENVDNNWIIKNKPTSLLCPAVITCNYYSPLARKVEELDKHVIFSFPHNHLNKNSAKWR